MNLDELRSVQNAERNKGGLQPLRESFYEEVGQYIADLKAERDRAAERADDPWSSPEVKRLTDEIETAEEVVEAIYERRMGKILDRASLAAAEMSADDDGLTAEERAMFSDLVERIRENKRTVLDTLDPGSDADSGTSGDARVSADSGSSPDAARSGQSTRDDPGPPGPDAPPSESSARADPDPVQREDPTPDAAGREDPAPDAGGTADADPGYSSQRSGTPGPSDEGDGLTEDLSPADAMGTGSAGDPGAGTAEDGADDSHGAGPGGGSGTGAGTARAGGADRVTVRITSDVGSILGIDDRQYHLEPEDVVELPAANADPLVERDAARKLE